MLGAFALSFCYRHLKKSLSLSLSAYDCDFFNKGKPALPTWSIEGWGPASPVLVPQQHQPS